MDGDVASSVQTLFVVPRGCGYFICFGVFRDRVYLRQNSRIESPDAVGLESLPTLVIIYLSIFPSSSKVP